MPQNSETDSSQPTRWVILYNLYFNSEMVASNLTMDEIAATRWFGILTGNRKPGEKLPLGKLGESTGVWIEEVQDPQAYRVAKVNRDRRAVPRDNS